MFSQLIVILNNFIKYNLIHLAFIEIFYKFKIKKLLNLVKIDDLDFDNFMNNIDSHQIS